jgi:hypothetical protein
LRATEIAASIGLFLAFLMASLTVVLPVAFGLSMNPMLLVLAAFVLFAGQRELQGVRQLEAQRRAAYRAAAYPHPELAPVVVPPAQTDTPFSYSAVPFTGVAWDSRQQIWVKWHNGHPVAYWE